MEAEDIANLFSEVDRATELINQLPIYRGEIDVRGNPYKELLGPNIIAVFDGGVYGQILSYNYKYSGVYNRLSDGEKQITYIGIYDIVHDKIYYPTQDETMRFTHIDEDNAYVRMTDNQWQNYEIYCQYINENMMDINDAYYILQQISPKDKENIDIKSLMGLLSLIQVIIYHKNDRENNNAEDNDIFKYFTTHTRRVVSELVASKYKLHYFMPLNPNGPAAKSALGLVPLTPENMENYCNIDALYIDELEVRESPYSRKIDGLCARKYGLNRIVARANNTNFVGKTPILTGYLGWSNKSLFDAIYTSDLFVPTGKQWRIKSISQNRHINNNPREKNRGQIMNYTLVTIINELYAITDEGGREMYRLNISYRNRDDQYVLQEVRKILFRRNNGLPLRDIGLNEDGFVERLIVTSWINDRDFYRAIYRKIFNTLKYMDLNLPLNRGKLQFLQNENHSLYRKIVREIEQLQDVNVDFILETSPVQDTTSDSIPLSDINRSPSVMSSPSIPSITPLELPSLPSIQSPVRSPPSISPVSSPPSIPSPVRSPPSIPSPVSSPPSIPSPVRSPPSIPSPVSSLPRMSPTQNDQ